MNEISEGFKFGNALIGLGSKIILALHSHDDRQ